jgi:hypothetical protein
VVTVQLRHEVASSLEGDRFGVEQRFLQMDIRRTAATLMVPAP